MKFSEENDEQYYREENFLIHVQQEEAVIQQPRRGGSLTEVTSADVFRWEGTGIQSEQDHSHWPRAENEMGAIR